MCMYMYIYVHIYVYVCVCAFAVFHLFYGSVLIPAINFLFFKKFLLLTCTFLLLLFLPWSNSVLPKTTLTLSISCQTLYTWF